MTKLVVEPFGLGSIEFGLSIPLESIDAYWAWQKIVTKFLFYAFLNRPACLITVAPQKWSLGRELTNEPEIIIDSKPYLLAFRDSCSAELLADVAESEDFQRGLLWLSSLSKENEAEIVDHIRAIIDSNYLLNIPRINEELLICGSDGNAIYWFNYPQPLCDVINIVSELAQSVGWDFDATPVEFSTGG